MLKKVRLQIITESYGVSGSFYEAADQCHAPDPNAPPTAPDDVQRTELVTTAAYHDDGHRVTLRYKENADSGMEGTETTVSFGKTKPDSISILRSGAVKCALQIEQGRRYFGVYQTPIMPFELCLLPRLVANGIEKTGVLQLDYTVELKGTEAQRNKLTLRIL